MAFGSGDGDSSNDINVKVSVDNKEATSALKAFFEGFVSGAKESVAESQKVTTAVEKVEKSVKGLGQVKLDSLLNNLSRLSTLAGQAFQNLERGAEVNDLTQGLDSLAKQAGTTGSALLNELNKATAGTISNFDLMSQAVKGLNADLKPDEIIKISEAARALGDRLGGDTKSKVEAFTQAVVSGNTRFLKSVGVYTDAKKANEDFSKSLYGTIKPLNEAGQRAALQAQALQLLEEKTKKVGEVTKDTGDAIQGIKKAYTDARDGAFAAAAGNEQLTTALNEVAAGLSRIDFSAILSGLVSVFDYATKAAGGLAAFGKALAETAGFGDANNPHLKGAAEAFKAINESLDTRDISKAREQLKKLVDVVHQLPDGLDKVRLQEVLTPQIAAANKEIGGLIGQLALSVPTFTKTTTSSKKLGDTLKGTGGNAKGTGNEFLDLGAIQKAGAASAKELQSAQDSVTDSLKDLLNIPRSSGSKDLVKLFTDFENGAVTSEEVLKKVTEQLSKLGTSKAMQDYGADAKAAAQEVRNLADAQEKAQKETVDFLAEIKKSGNSLADALGGASDSDLTTAKNIFGTKQGNFFGFDVGLSDSVASGTQQALTTGLQAGIDAAFSGEFDFTSLQNVSASMAGSIAESFLPGSGPIASALTHGIVGLFESKDSAGTAARKEADRYFADVFDASRLSIIVGGELKQIKDLVFSGSTAFGGNVSAGKDGFFGFLNSLPAEARASFAGVGTAFEELLGIGEDVGGQLAAVFANNVGGSLNNLQLLVYATGKSFDELKVSVIDAFLNGKLSAKEAQVAINGLRQVLTKGIPDGVGQTVQAFNNLRAAGIKGGRASTDALRDIAYEANELGLKTIPATIQQMVSSGQVGANEVGQVFDALAANGITSLAQLAGASDERLIGVVARLQDVGFAFKDPVDGAAALVDKLNELQSRDITLNVNTNLDQNTKDVLEFAQSGGVSSVSAAAVPGADSSTTEKSLRLRRSLINGRAAFDAEDLLSTSSPKTIEDEGEGSKASSSSNSSKVKNEQTAKEKAAQKAKERADKNKEAIEKATDALKDYHSEVESAAESSDRYKAIIEAITNKTISSERGQRLLNETYQDAGIKVDALNEAEKARDRLLRQAAAGQHISNAELYAAEAAVYRAKKAVDDFGTSIEKVKGKDPLEGFFRIGAVANVDQVVGALGGTGKFDANAAKVIQEYIKNFSGDANKLGVILRQVGVNAEDAKKLIVDSFNAGQISAVQASKAIRDIGQALDDGIPEKVGAFTDAFSSFLKDGINGGAFTIDDLKDIFAEAKEAGINDIGSLQASLIDSGKFSSEQIGKLFESLWKNNIHNMEQALDISDTTAIAVTSSFYEAGGAIAVASDEVTGLIKSLNDLQALTYIARVEIQTTVTGDGAEWLTGDGITSTGDVSGGAKLESTGGSGGSIGKLSRSERKEFETLRRLSRTGRLTSSQRARFNQLSGMRRAA